MKAKQFVVSFAWSVGMSTSLLEALTGVDLQPGHTYRCVVNGCRVVLHVLPGLHSGYSHSTNVEEVPFEDPFDHPFPEPSFRNKVVLGNLPLPDPLELPPDVYEEPLL